MKILVLSDTHIPKKAKRLPDNLVEELSFVDAIVHAGDWQTLDVYDQLKVHKPVYGVYGNVDDEEIRNKLPKKQTIDLNGYRVGIVHGHGNKKTTEKRAIEAFESDPVDLLIFGHSHIPVLRYFKKTLLFNPGSVTDKRRLPFYSFGIIDLAETTIHAEHVFFK